MRRWQPALVLFCTLFHDFVNMVNWKTKCAINDMHGNGPHNYIIMLLIHDDQAWLHVVFKNNFHWNKGIQS